MQDQILRNLEDPKALEALFRHNKQDFRLAFSRLHPTISHYPAAAFWYERLNYARSRVTQSTISFTWVVALCLLAGLMAKLPAFTGWSPEQFYPKNFGFLVLPFLSILLLWGHRVSWQVKLVLAGLYGACLLYINLLPPPTDNSTVALAIIHLPVLLLAVNGLAYLRGESGNLAGRTAYLRYMGELGLLTAGVLAAGVALTGLTFGLFELINLRIEQFYLEYVVVFGLVSAPQVALHLLRQHTQIVHKIIPVLARIFSPLLLITLAIYLLTIVVNRVALGSNRDMLLLFNVLLAGVIALILFTISTTGKFNKNHYWVLFGLALVAFCLNCLALTGIIFRLNEWGFTPNRTAVLGANLLFLGNIVALIIQFIKVMLAKGTPTALELTQARYLPLYVAWAAVVVFLFPLLFGTT